VKSKITHMCVIWKAAGAGDPVLYFDEIDSERWSLRCIREYVDGTRRDFCNTSYNWRDVMPEAPIPPRDKINADTQFQARNISRKEFEALWMLTHDLNQYSMMEPLLVALPEFVPYWIAFVVEWKDNPHNKVSNSLPHYLVIATLAGFLVNLLEHNQTERFAAVFAIVEHWLANGDRYVCDAAGAGLLEDLQNPVHYKNYNPDDFKRWFGKITLCSWERLKNS
jgi:hypothetical protein